MTTIEASPPGTPFAPSNERATMLTITPVVDAVCDELGIAGRERARRAAVEERILAAWNRGPRQPLDLVRAGLDG